MCGDQHIRGRGCVSDRGAGARGGAAALAVVPPLTVSGDRHAGRRSCRLAVARNQSDLQRRKERPGDRVISGRPDIGDLSVGRLLVRDLIAERGP